MLGHLLEPGSVYNLINFFGSKSKEQYRVADHVAIVSFSWNSSLSVLENPPVIIPEDRFRFHGYEEFKANCDSAVDLYGKTCLTLQSTCCVWTIGVPLIDTLS